MLFRLHLVSTLYATRLSLPHPRTAVFRYLDCVVAGLPRRRRVHSSAARDRRNLAGSSLVSQVLCLKENVFHCLSNWLWGDYLRLGAGSALLANSNPLDRGGRHCLGRLWPDGLGKIPRAATLSILR